MDYQEALQKLHSLERASIHPGLARIEELCLRLGQPQRQLRHIVHITGTNGKGSVAAMLESILRKAGKTTALFTSPHLHSHTERYRVAGLPVSEERFAELFSRVYAEHRAMVAAGFPPPTEFETVTALALLWFAQEDVDHAIIEVGLGGLTDSTNVVKADMAIITNVGLDHSEFLGDTIAEVARYKAGIIKSGAVVVTAAEAEALGIITAKAAAEHARLYVQGEDFIYFPLQLGQEGSVADIVTAKCRYQGLNIPLLGSHQIANAAVAVQAAELLGMDEPSIRAGLAAAKWPARLEMLGKSPQILLDGAHNYAGMMSLCDALDSLWPKAKIVCVLGMLSDKEREKSLALLLPRISRFVITRPPYLSRSEGWQMLAQICRANGKETVAIEDNREAMRYALETAKGDELILVCGSLYMVAEVRNYLQEVL